MLKRRNISKWLMIILTICFLSSGSASAYDSELNDSDSDGISHSIKEFANDPSFIAYRGNLPETTDQKWENSIVNCWLNLTRMGPSYSEFDSSIKSVASNNKVIIIELGSAYKEEVNDFRIDKIYKKIDDYCEQQEGISEIPVVFMWAQDDEDLPLPDYGPEMFKKAENSSNFIAARGTMPVITNDGEKMEWIDLLVRCTRNNKEIVQYFVSSNGPVVSFGSYIDGYLEVGLDSATPEKVNESIIDEIYGIIDKQCEKEGITDVPVVFVWIEVSTTAEAINEPPSMEGTLENTSTSDINDGSTQNMPGFTSIMQILCLLLLVKTRE